MGSATAITSVVDATANSGTPKTKQGNRPHASLTSSGPERIYHIQTPVPCPYGSTVTSAKLRLYQYDASGGSRTLTLRRITQSWKESSLTWKNRPTRLLTPSATLTVSGAGSQGRVIEFDVTADVQAFSDRSVPNYGWAVESSNNNLLTIYTSEAKQYQPRLIVSWTERPETPTDLTPGGGGIVAIPKPILRWSFVDLAGDTTMSGFAIQAASTPAGWTPTGAFPTPDFATGVIDSASPQYDLGPSGYNGLLTNGYMYWTVAHRDGSGLWSNWSDPTLVYYQPPQVVGLTSPAGSVSDTTFPWEWTAADQVMLQLQIRDTANNVLWDSGRLTNPALRSFTQPRGVIKAPGVTYRAVARVWDSLSRQDVPGAPGYVEVVNDFVYADDPAVDPPLHVDFRQLPTRPGVRITWTRVAAPAQFGIWINGQEYLVDDAADLLESGTGYALDIIDMPPRRDHSVVVKAIEVDGDVTKASVPGEPIVVRMEPAGVWLLDPTDPGRDVVMFSESGTEIVSTDMPEVNASFTPEGSSVTIPVTASLRWFEGRVSGGQLADTDFASAAEFRARLLAMKGDRLSQYILMWGTHVVPVYISNVNVQYVDVAAERYSVDFDFVAATPSPEYVLS